MPTSVWRHTPNVRPHDYPFLWPNGWDEDKIFAIQSADTLGTFPGTATGNETWVAANDAYLTPVVVNRPGSLTTAWWVNGSGTPTDSVDVGLYDSSFALLGSTGATAISGSGALQSAALTATVTIRPGLYYIAVASNGTTANQLSFWVMGSLSNARAMGAVQQATAYPLPSTITPATYAGPPRLPYCGFYGATF